MRVTDNNNGHFGKFNYFFVWTWPFVCNFTVFYETSFFYKNRPKTHVFTQKISELFAWNSGNREPSFTKTEQFHAKRVSFTQNGKFTQKISELSKKSVIIFWRSGQFHAKTVKNDTKLVSRWSKLPCFFERREFW